MRRALTIVVHLLLAACGAHRATDAPLVELVGVYTPGFEKSRFVPCDARAGDAPWWVILSADALLQRDSLAARLPEAAGRTVWVRWRAVVGPEGSTGHLGASARWVHVAEIVEMRAVDDGIVARCASASTWWSDAS